MRVFWREWDRRFRVPGVSAPAVKAQALPVTRAELETFSTSKRRCSTSGVESGSRCSCQGRAICTSGRFAARRRPGTTLFGVADDYHRLTERVKRLGKKNAHVEFPHSRCRRMVSNVRIRAARTIVHGDVELRDLSRKRGVTETYLGHHRYELCGDAGAIKSQETSFID